MGDEWSVRRIGAAEAAAEAAAAREAAARDDAAAAAEPASPTTADDARADAAPAAGGLADGLADLLIDCVEGGASVSFMLPLPRAKARAFWRDVLVATAAGERVLLVAEDRAGRVVGTLQLVCSMPDNQPHRADVAKMLVHRAARRRGVAQRLLSALEEAALEAGKEVLVLDTVTGGDAERLYERAGWQRVGSVPRYALMPEGGFCATTFFHKQLGSGVASDTRG